MEWFGLNEKHFSVMRYLITNSEFEVLTVIEDIVTDEVHSVQEETDTISVQIQAPIPIDLNMDRHEKRKKLPNLNRAILKCWKHTMNFVWYQATIYFWHRKVHLTLEAHTRTKTMQENAMYWNGATQILINIKDKIRSGHNYQNWTRSQINWVHIVKTTP